MTGIAQPSKVFERRDVRQLSKEVLWLAVIGGVYFVLAKLSLQLASINPSATPIWPPTGYAIAALLLFGYRVWPAILLGAFLANATTSGTLFTSSAISLGNTAEGLIAAYLVNVWAGGLRTFDSPSGVAKFALVNFAASTPVSATIGVGSLTMAGFAEPSNVAAIWLTWWLGDFAGALLVTPVMVLWFAGNWTGNRQDLLNFGAVLAVTIAVGIVAFSPLVEQTSIRGPLGFLAVVPLVWAALRCSPRETATVALVLSGFAVWGTISNGGPFAADRLNDSFLLLAMFMISTSLPSLVLSADVAMRRSTQAELAQKEHALRAMFSQALVGIAQCNSDGRVLFANRKFGELLQRSPGELVGRSLQELADGDDAAKLGQAVSRISASDEGSVVENRFVRPDGSRVWVRNFVSGLSDLDERGARHLLVVSEDVTERKEADARQGLLIAELDHRVRNILAGIQSMIRVSARNARTKEDYVGALEGRIAAMARTHALLTRKRWGGASLRQILSDELAPYQVLNGAVDLPDAPDVTLRPKEALDFALLVHELATNAAKHGAFSRDGGKVDLAWRCEDDAGAKRLVFEWLESGGPPLGKVTHRGFGLTLIESTFGASPDQSVDLRFEPGGVHCIVSMPIPAQAPVATSEPERSGMGSALQEDGSRVRGRILVIEDELLVGIELKQLLSEAGLDVIGPVGTLRQALVISDEPGIAAALLDVNIRGEMVYPVAERLLARGIPVLFLTGYETLPGAPEGLSAVPVLNKPVNGPELLRALGAVIDRQPQSQRV